MLVPPRGTPPSLKGVGEKEENKMYLIDVDAIPEVEMNYPAWVCLKKQSPIDAVLVVRCGECRFGRNPLPAHGVRQCAKTLQLHPNDWYCPNGKRKDGE